MLKTVHVFILVSCYPLLNLAGYGDHLTAELYVFGLIVVIELLPFSCKFIHCCLNTILLNMKTSVALKC